MRKKANAKKEIESLASERDRSNKAPLTIDERIEILERIRDGAAIWMQQAVVSGSSSGTGAAQLLYEKNAHEVERLKRLRDLNTDTGESVFVWTRYEPETASA